MSVRSYIDFEGFDRREYDEEHITYRYRTSVKEAAVQAGVQASGRYRTNVKEVGVQTASKLTDQLLASADREKKLEKSLEMEARHVEFLDRQLSQRDMEIGQLHDRLIAQRDVEIEQLRDCMARLRQTPAVASNYELSPKNKGPQPGQINRSKPRAFAIDKKGAQTLASEAYTLDCLRSERRSLYEENDRLRREAAGLAAMEMAAFKECATEFARVRSENSMMKNIMEFERLARNSKKKSAAKKPPVLTRRIASGLNLMRQGDTSLPIDCRVPGRMFTKHCLC